MKLTFISIRAFIPFKQKGNVSKLIGNLPCRVRKANIKKDNENFRNKSGITKDLLELIGRIWVIY